MAPLFIQIILTRFVGVGARSVRSLFQAAKKKRSVVSSTKRTTIRFSELKRRRYWYPLMLGIGLLVLQQLSGINGMLFYSNNIFKSAGRLIMMRISLSACKELPSLVSFPVGLNMDNFIPWRRKDKVVIVMGATGTGKSRLSIDLATLFPAEIVNSDKMQVYRGLDITTNKVTEEECRGIPHHLLGIVDPDEDFTALDFHHHASLTVESILRRGRLPIIAGGSNSYIEALVNDNAEFQSKYDCCFLWVDVSMPVLHSFVSDRVNKMVQAGLVDELRNFFHPEGDYSRGIRRAIGVPELDQYFRAENDADEATRARLLEDAIEKIKSNTCQLACRQLRNILRLQDQLGWNMHHLDATEAFLKRGPDSDESWERLVARPSAMIVGHFLEADHHDFVVPSHLATPPPSSSIIVAAAATH